MKLIEMANTDWDTQREREKKRFLVGEKLQGSVSVTEGVINTSIIQQQHEESEREDENENNQDLHTFSF